MRYPSVAPGDVPAELAARRMGLTKGAFESVLPQLQRRGFPLPDPDTGLYDLDAIDQWRKRRNPHLYPEIGSVAAPQQAIDVSDVFESRLAQIKARDAAEVVPARLEELRKRNRSNEGNGGTRKSAR